MYFKYQSLMGKLIGKMEEDGSLSGLWFEGQKYFPVIPDEAKWLTKESDAPLYLLESSEKIKEQLKAYELGMLKKFDLTLSPKGTEFQKLVWKQIENIPYGQRITYGQIGAKVAEIQGKRSMSAQAVGQAVGHNPIAIVIPCHRVVGAKGQLTGYAGGVDRKEALLALEERCL